MVSSKSKLIIGIIIMICGAIMAFIGIIFSVDVLVGIMFKINAVDNSYVLLIPQLKILVCLTIGGLIMTIIGSAAVFSSKKD